MKKALVSRAASAFWFRFIVQALSAFSVSNLGQSSLSTVSGECLI